VIHDPRELDPPFPYLLPNGPPAPPFQFETTQAEKVARIEYFKQNNCHPEQDGLKWDQGTQSWVPDQK
jgi:hypothetical protein